MMGAQTLEFELPTEWKSLTVTLHIEREGGDRVENAGLMGIPIPAVVTKAIEVLRQRAEHTET